jgi:hypothetical protein
VEAPTQASQPRAPAKDVAALLFAVATLAAGLIDERRAEVIAVEPAGPDDEHAAAVVEKLIVGKAPGLPSGQLRVLVRRAVLSADPAPPAAGKRRAASYLPGS